MKLRFQTLWLSLCTGALLLLAMGCNDNLRQFITPVPPPTGDPQTPANAVTLSNNLPSTQGSTLHINVSGDTNVGIQSVGISPVFLGKAGGNLFTINNGDATNPPTLTVYAALLAGNATPTTVTLPNPAAGPVAGGTSSTGNIYIANKASSSVDVIGVSVLAQTLNIPLPANSNPVMIAGNGASNQIFVVNNGNGVAAGSVTQISTIDNTVLGNIPVGINPIWAVMSTDGFFVFVVNQGDGVSNGSISVIDTAPATPSAQNVIATIPVGISPNFAFYETTTRRLYVSNTGSNFISVINTNGISATNPPTASIPVQVGVNVAGTSNPTSVTALSDGTKAYVALGNCPAGTNHLNILTNLPNCNGNLVSVIDAVGLRETKTIAVGAGAVSVDSSGDASKAFVISAHDITTIRDNVHLPNCTGPNCLPAPPLPDRTFSAPSISIIRTATDGVVITPVDPSVVNSPLPSFHVPQQDPNCSPTIDPNFNSIVPMPCALQTPFVIRTFP